MRVLLKISGEAFRGDSEFGVNHEAACLVASKIRELQKQGIEVGVVLGGGNIFRGIQQGPETGIERTPADQIGMLATLMNGIVLQRALIREGCKVKLMSAVDCPMIAESFQWDRTMQALADRTVLIFVGGTGHPYFTTDTCAALRACEIHADLLLKATTRVDGIYDKDPRKHKEAKLFKEISYEKVLEMQLGILDLSAVTMCMTANIPIRVFNFYASSLLDALSENAPGTIVR